MPLIDHCFHTSSLNPTQNPITRSSNPTPKPHLTGKKKQTMPQILIFPLILLCLSIFYLFRRRKPATLPPSPPKLPIIGHLHLLGEMPHQTLRQLSEKHGDLMFLQLGQIPTLVISSARLAKAVMKTHDHAFASRPALVSAQYLSFGCSDVTFSPYGAYWRQARKICVTELLSSKRIQSSQYIRREEVDRLIEAVRAESGSEVDMSQLFFSLANNVLCRVAFGRRFSSEDGKSRLQEILTATQELLAGFSVGDFFPAVQGLLNRVTGLHGKMMRNLHDLDTVSSEIIAEHLDRNRKTREEREEDFVDVLLRVQKDGDLEVPITDDNLKALVLDMFVAGTDTTSATLEWTMTQLARHPTVLQKAQEEVRRVAGTRGRVEENDLPQLHYLRSVIKETFRLHPPVPLLVPRESIEKCTLDGYEIPAKTRVLVNAYAIGRDPHTWKDPSEYLPERFLGSSIDFKGQDFELLPFGGGRRGCPGYSFGLATIELALAGLLYHFDWELPRGVSANNVDLGEIFGLATRKRVPLILVASEDPSYKFIGTSFS